MKDIAEIKTLIERFFEGDTSLEEERWLYDYFKQTKDLPEELETYRETFLDFDAIILTEVPSPQVETKAQTIFMPQAEQSVSTTPPKYYRLWRRMAGIAAMVAIVIGVAWGYRTYESRMLEQLYGGSYMIVNGERIDDLRKILPQIENALSLADAVEIPSSTDLIEQAEQDLLNNIQDAQERERINKLLNQ